MLMELGKSLSYFVIAHTHTLIHTIHIEEKRAEERRGRFKIFLSRTSSIACLDPHPTLYTSVCVLGS